MYRNVTMKTPCKTNMLTKCFYKNKMSMKCVGGRGKCVGKANLGKRQWSKAD
jgi:hypothetical protein